MNTAEIIKTIRSGVSGIQIQGKDHLRIDEYIADIAIELDFKILEWNWGYGWVDFKNKHALRQERAPSLCKDLKIIADDDPTNKLYIIKNAYAALTSSPESIARLQQELLRIKRNFFGKSAIILIANKRIDFSDLTDLFITFNCPPLASREVETIVHSFLKEHSITITTEVKSALISTCSGMEQDKLFQVMHKLKNSYGNRFTEKAINAALAMKKNLLSQSGLLELVDTDINISQIGGLKQLEKWLRSKKHIINNLHEAQRLNVAAPKGVLLAGMPGCGKSMCAKAAASLFNVPLLRLDIGSLMGKFVGESEANMKTALEIAEKASPCVLWIDEMEKAFSGINGTGGSTEITTRLFGYFLTWMQEKPGAVFVAATANDITTIPPELLRRGRFDEIFYVDLPNKHEREQIFKVHIKQRFSLSQRLSQGLDFKELAKKTEGFSGADIECVINDALEELFRKRQANLNQKILERHINLITPISLVLKDKIDSYRELFNQFKLKSASLSDDDFKKMETLSESDDPTEREDAASNEFLSPEKLVELIKDDDIDVRKAVLNNQGCPVEVLNQVVEDYQPFDFTKPGLWRKREVTTEEFNLALKHPNMSSELLLKLYKNNKIDSDRLLSYAHKLKNGHSSVFEVVTVKLPHSINSGIVRRICCSIDDIIESKDTLIEIDDEKNNTRAISAKIVGRVLEIYIQIGENISSGDVLAKILRVKKGIKS